MGVKIVSSGMYLPPTILSNADLEKMVETNNEWIVDRTGIERRHIATFEKSADLAVEAAEKALEGIDKDTIDMVVVATVTPDEVTPYMASIIKKKIGLNNARTFDVNAACSGFVYGTWIVSTLMEASMKERREKDKIKRTLLIGTERLSRITNYEDRNTCVLFGDGAGAVLFEYDENEKGVLGAFVKNYDDVEGVLTCGTEYRKIPFSEDEQNPQYLDMRGTKVFRWAVPAVNEVIAEVLDKTGLTADDIAYFVPHQANLRIIKGIATKLKQPLEKFQINIQETGNVSSATIPMALDELLKSGKGKKGDKILLAGFGGGLSAAAAIIEL